MAATIVRDRVRTMAQTIESTVTQEQSTAVDRYITDLLTLSDPALEATLEAGAAAGMPAINVAPNMGKMLQILAKAVGARNILEIGTLAGYSTIWLARALPPGGRLITLEFNPLHAEVASASIARAGLQTLVELRLGPALETLPRLVEEKRGPFDLIFIDADKESYTEYLEWSLKLSRRGTLIVADNVVRKGAVADPTTRDPMVQGIRRFNDRLAREKGVSATAIQTVGSKGYDGFALIVVERPEDR
jgi:predicted O-methyltransferase YrrM